MNLRQLFPNVSNLAFKTVDDQPCIVGKFAEISIIEGDGCMDVWLITPDRQPIGTRKLNNLCNEAVAQYPEANIARLDGEAHYKCSEIPEKLLRSFGIRIKRKMSEEQRQKTTANLAKFRRGKTNERRRSQEKDMSIFPTNHDDSIDYD